VIDQPCLYRVFLIRFGNSVGSAFAIDVDGKQYLVTAKHVVPRINDGDEIEIFFKERFNRAPIRVVECEPKDVDAIVFALPMQIASGDCPEPNAANLILSQDIYFLGFPFGWRPKTKLLDNPDFPIPYVKKGIVSSLEEFESAGPTFYIDGQSNPGFSGGPAIFQLQAQGSSSFRIAGVIHGQVATEEPVIDPGPGRDPKTGVDPRIETGLITQSDAGLVLVYGIQSVIAAIKKKPIGFVI